MNWSIAERLHRLEERQAATWAEQAGRIAGLVVELMERRTAGTASADDLRHLAQLEVLLDLDGGTP
jgi:uncharacterized coiled-coil protein SlyX